MFGRSLQRRPLPHLLLAASIGAGCAVVLLGCNSTTDDSTIGYLGYIYSDDFEGERRWLHLPTTPEPITRCLYSELPPEEFRWREFHINPDLQRAAAALIEDQAALEHYEADTDASREQTRRVCIEQPGETDFCYFPNAIVSRFDVFIWKFWLGPEVTLSPQSWGLIEALRAAHGECWAKGTPAPGYGGDN